MIVGTVRELKIGEHRVGLTPEGADALVRAGHQVLVEAGAGAGSGFADEAYRAVGAEVVDAVTDVWAQAELVVKVKEPLPEEFGRIRPEQILFTYLHLAALPETTRALLDSGAVAVAYETVQLSDGTLPLLIPMSQIAGRLATEVAAQWLRKPGPGRGKLLSGLPGAAPARVVILGAGTVSSSACAVAVALGADVTVLSRGLDGLRSVEERWPGRVTTYTSTPYSIGRALEGADALIGGVLVTGEAAPKLVSREQVRTMGAGAVVVDVDIDQGGCVETARPTTHEDPVYVEEGVVHYGVANMPGSVPQTSTGALTAATLPYVLRLAEGGLDALRSDPALTAGVNIARGQVTNPGVAEAAGRPLVAPGDLL
ncbi:MAG: alanine dehydrogenase [Dehalococcoidia bacterium]|nr:alanine dehydrogenase [Dehalococcoidia bacterium]